MIRFLNLKNQICDDSQDFAFYDTVSETILTFGTEQVFESIEDFKMYFNETQSNKPINRFLELIPSDYFTN